MRSTSVGPSGIVHELLTKDNYERWEGLMKNYLRGQGLWDIVSRWEDIEQGFLGSVSAEEEREASRSREMKDAKVLHIIQLCCEPEILDEISHFKTAKSAWNHLSELYGNSLVHSRHWRVAGILDNGLSDEQKELFRKVERGDDIGNIDMDEWDIWITFPTGRTLLHVATIGGNKKNVEKLVKAGRERLLYMEDNRGYTALALSARYTGNTDIARCMVEMKRIRTEKLLTIMNKNKNVEIPVILAAANGHKEMTTYLYSHTPHEVFDNDSINRLLLFYLCITAEIFDVALRLLKRYSSDLPRESLLSRICIPESLRNSLSLPPRKLSDMMEYSSMETSQGDHFSPLEALARLPSAFRSGHQFSLWENFIYNNLSVEKKFRDNYGIPNIKNFVMSVTRVKTVADRKRQKSCFLHLMHWGWFFCKVVLMTLLFLPIKLLGLLLRGTAFVFKCLNIFGIKKIYDQKYSHYEVLGILNYLCQSIEKFDERELIEASASEAMLHAAQYGIMELIIAMRNANHSLLSAVDSDFRGIFSHAILNHKKEVFQLIYAMSEEKEIIRYQIDRFGNNLLHLAAYLGPSSDRDTRSGAALQMQRELQWFKAVEKVVHLRYKEAKNHDGKKPYELFTQNHEEKVQAGEKWAKETAASFTIVATLITTIMFAAVFTVPGGNNGDTGLPIFLYEKAFTTFLIADAISLFTSATSVLIFIGILTSRYTEKDFLTNLPWKLLFALLFLFLAVCSMIVVFCATIIIILQGYRTYKWFVVAPTMSLGIIPIIILLLSQLRLMYSIVRSTWKNPIII